MDGAARRRQIVEAVTPLFARKGFAGVTTREIAAAAGVSEGLVFRHFPTKAALCQEIIENARRAEPQLMRLAMLPPSTDTLILITFALVHHLVLGRLGQPELVTTRQRIVLLSMTEDGEYARAYLTEIEHCFLPALNASLRAAEQAGDVRPGGSAPANGMWFGALVTALIVYGQLSRSEVFPTQGGLDARVTEAARFILRGIGLRDEVIAAPFDLRSFMTPLEIISGGHAEE
jgi:AcrR family transcriptional regulator